MPKVIFNIGFTPYKCPSRRSPEKHAAERAFYNGTASYNYFDYSEKDTKVVKDEKKPGTNYMEKTSGVFNQNGVLTGKQKAELAEKLKNTKSIIWHGFISFDEETSKLFNTQAACIDFINGTMSTYFKENRLDMDKIELFCSLHSDTDNRHIHFSFFEREPATMNSKGYPAYRKSGVFGKKVGERYELSDGTVVEEGTKGARKKWIYDDAGRDCFLYKANMYLEENKFSLHAERDALMNEMKALTPAEMQKQQNKELRASLKELAKKIPPQGRKTYGSKEMAFLRPDIDKVVKQFIDTVPGLRRGYDAWNIAFYAKESEAKRICARENLPYAPHVENRVHNERFELAKNLGNKVINLALDMRKEEVKAFVTNDLARKIEAKNNRRMVDRALARAAKYGTNNGRGQVPGYDYSRILHKIEQEIELERQRQAVVYGA